MFLTYLASEGTHRHRKLPQVAKQFLNFIQGQVTLKAGAANGKGGFEGFVLNIGNPDIPENPAPKQFDSAVIYTGWTSAADAEIRNIKLEACNEPLP